MERQNSFSTSRRSGFARLVALVLGVTLIANLNTGNVVAKGTKNVVEKAVKSTTKDVEKAVKQDVKQEVKSTTKDVEKEKKQLGPKEVKSLKGVTLSQSPNDSDSIKVTLGKPFEGTKEVTISPNDMPTVEKHLKVIIKKITKHRPTFKNEKQFQEVVQILKNITSIELPCDVAKEILEYNGHKFMIASEFDLRKKVSLTVKYLWKLFLDAGFHPQPFKLLMGVYSNPNNDFFTYLDKAIREG